MADHEVIDGGSAFGDRFDAVLGAPRTPGWSGADELFGPALPAVLAEVGDRRGTGNPAVAAALLFEQYAHRLASPVLLALLRDGAVLDARPSRVSVLVQDGALRRVAFARVPAVPAEEARERAVRALLVGLDPAADALHRHTRVGRRVLAGAMANAVASAGLHLSWPGPDRARHVDATLALLDLVPGWPGLVNVRAEPSGGEPWMYTDRNTCCLAFRTTVNRAREQHYCGTCPAVPRATTAAMFAQATETYRRRART